MSDAAEKAEGMKSSLSDAAKKAEDMKSSLPSQEEVDKKINIFLAETRNKFTAAKSKYDTIKQTFKKKLKEREAKNEERKQQQLKMMEALEEAKKAKEKEEKEKVISKLQLQIQSFDKSIQQKIVEIATIKQSKTDFQKTIDEKNTIIKEETDKKCTGILSRMGFGKQRCQKAREEEKKKIQASIEQIKQDISKADEEIADIDNKKSEFTKMIEDANEQIKKLEGSQESMQGGRKKRRKKKRTKKKSRKRKGKRTRKNWIEFIINISYYK